MPKKLDEVFGSIREAPVNPQPAAAVGVWMDPDFDPGQKEISGISESVKLKKSNKKPVKPEVKKEKIKFELPPKKIKKPKKEVEKEPEPSPPPLEIVKTPPPLPPPKDPTPPPKVPTPPSKDPTPPPPKDPTPPPPLKEPTPLPPPPGNTYFDFTNFSFIFLYFLNFEFTISFFFLKKRKKNRKWLLPNQDFPQPKYSRPKLESTVSTESVDWY